MAVRWLIVRVFHPSSPVGRQATSPANASSVPGNRQTAMLGSSAAAKPRVPVPKSRVISLSPTFAGRERTLWRLKSHIGDSFFHSQDSWVFPRQTPHYPQTTRSSKNGAVRDLQQDLCLIRRPHRWGLVGISAVPHVVAKPTRGRTECASGRLHFSWAARGEGSMAPPP